jgi:starch-binding outer membrane protein, SusD/RagB family
MQLASVDLDKILDERELEFCGENIRWFDLKSTNKLEQLIQNNISARKYFDLNKHYLRPLPAIQMLAVSN